MGSSSLLCSTDVSYDSRALWQACVEKLEQLLPPYVMEGCLRESQARREEPNRLVVTLPHNFACDQLRRFKTRIDDATRSALDELGAAEWKVEWATQPLQAEPLPQEPVAAAPAPKAARASAPRSIVPRVKAPRPSNDEPPDEKPLSDTRFTFDRLVTGPSNQMAVHAARKAAENPGKNYNPLVIYGDVGLGKTHLMLALKHLTRTLRPRTRLVYTSSETFTNELVDALQENRIGAFRKKYRHVDLLMIDDVEFLIGKERTLEEFYHTFEEVAGSGRQVILTCDRPPQLLSHIQERLFSRLSSGLIADIQAPTLEMRREILRQRARESQANLTDDVVDFIAASFAGSVRNLEGALVRVLAYADAVGEQTATLAVARRALHGLTPTPKGGRTSIVTLNNILEKVSHYYHVHVDDLVGARRDRRYSGPRHIAMYLAQELARMRCREIAEAFGNRDYSTVQHGVNKVTKERDQPSVKSDLEHLRALLGH